MSEYDVLEAIAEALEKAYKLCGTNGSGLVELRIDSTNYSIAKRLMYDTIATDKHQTAIIYGPPGTGKTKLVSETLYDLVYRGEGPFAETKTELIFYVAPTNDLVVSAMQRIFTNIFCAFLRRGEVESISSIIYGTKVLGSKIVNAALNSSSIDKLEMDITRRFNGIIPDSIKKVLNELRRLVGQKPTILAHQWMDIDLIGARLIFTTAYQTLKIKDIDKIAGIYVIYDEASKIEQVQSRRVLLSILQNYIKKIVTSKSLADLSNSINKYVESIDSLIAIGDKFQAITVRPIAGRKYSKLLMEELESIVSENEKAVLDVTLRLPYPTEVSLSEAFYRKHLNTPIRAHRELTQEKIKLIEWMYDYIRDTSLIEKIRRTLIGLSSPEYRGLIERVVDGYWQSIEEKKPGILIDLSSSWDSGRYNKEYVASIVALSTIESIVLSWIRKEYGGELEEECHDNIRYARNVCLDLLKSRPIMILSLYKNIVEVEDLALYVSRRVSDVIGVKVFDTITSKTVSSNIGNEAPIVLYKLPKTPAIFGDQESTFIVKDPLQLVVGTSRHSLVRAIVGNIDQFIRGAVSVANEPSYVKQYPRQNATYMRGIAEMLEKEEELADRGKIVRVEY